MERLTTAMELAPDPLHASALWAAVAQNFADPIAPLLLQFIVIILATRALGALFSRLRQPPVIGEILAGIGLGPSLLGSVWPSAFALVFPKDSLGVLHLFSQIGVCLFMFVVGMELDLGHLRQKARTAVAVSQSSIIVPYIFGVAIAHAALSIICHGGEFIRLLRTVHGYRHVDYRISGAGAYPQRPGYDQECIGLNSHQAAPP